MLEKSGPRVGAWPACEEVGANPPARRKEVEAARCSNNLRCNTIQEWQDALKKVPQVPQVFCVPAIVEGPKSQAVVLDRELDAVEGGQAVCRHIDVGG